MNRNKVTAGTEPKEFRTSASIEERKGKNKILPAVQSSKSYSTLKTPVKYSGKMSLNHSQKVVRAE